jgi:N-terminal beta-sandwich domain of polyadenylation factor
LEAGYELRISNIENHIKVLLIEGQADVFGREIPVGEPVFFNNGEKIAIFCWKPSHFKISGECEAYSSD